MAIIKSGATSDLLTVDATSLAVRVSPYDNLGVRRGPKACYRAAGSFASAASALPFFAISGSVDRVSAIQSITVTCRTLTAVAYNTILVRKYLGMFNGGVTSPFTRVSLDTARPESTCALVAGFTGGPTATVLLGQLGSQRILLQATAAVAATLSPPIEETYRLVGETGAVYLRSRDELLSLAFGAAPATAVTMSIQVEWTEELT